MKKLSAPAYRRARDFIHAQARPLERARVRARVRTRPARGRARRARRVPEPRRRLRPRARAGRAAARRLRAIATLTGLDVLREIDASADEPLVRRSARLGGRAATTRRCPAGARCPRSVDDFAHANHWSWALHAPGGGWPHFTIPGARLLSHLQHWRSLAPSALLASYGEAFRAHVQTLSGTVGGDSLYYALDGRRSEPARRAVRARARERAARTRPSGPST